MPMPPVCPPPATLQRENVVVGGTFTCDLRSASHKLPLFCLQFLLPRSCLCGVAARRWRCPGPSREKACRAYKRIPRSSKAPPPFGCLLLSVRGGHGGRCDGNSYLCTCEITSELWAYVRVEVAGPVLLAKNVKTMRVLFPLPPAASKFRSQKCALNICERQTASEEHLGPIKPVAPILCNRWMPPPCSQSMPS